ncbi:hypothetical protein, partial [Candidatus Binatus sp.]|uniref:hypothetical protein n=1 Tax=Candidatus Binatus sp. TaxID=2811406 RepID=UPI003CC1F191
MINEATPSCVRSSSLRLLRIASPKSGFFGRSDLPFEARRAEVDLAFDIVLDSQPYRPLYNIFHPKISRIRHR